MVESKNVTVAFYTGEYARAFEKCLHEANVMWWRSESEGLFEDGFGAAAEQFGRDYALGNGGNAWAHHVEKQLAMSGGYATAMLTPLHLISEIFYIHAAAEQLLEVARRFAEVLKSNVGESCGDDEHYDYFPDAMEALYQTCTLAGPGGKALYERTRKFAWDNHWSETEEYDGKIDACFTAWGSHDGS